MNYDILKGKEKFEYILTKVAALGVQKKNWFIWWKIWITSNTEMEVLKIGVKISDVIFSLYSFYHLA